MIWVKCNAKCDYNENGHCVLSWLHIRQDEPDEMPVCEDVRKSKDAEY